MDQFSEGTVCRHRATYKTCVVITKNDDGTIKVRTKDDVDRKFGGMIRAFQYGAPPHGGCAPGIDRLMMVLWECPSIRDIYAFPKNGKAQDVMMGSPSLVTEKQLN